MAKRKRSRWHYVRTILGQTWSHPSNRGRRIPAVVRTLRWQIRKRADRGPLDVEFFGWTLRCYPDSNSASNVVYFTERYDAAEMAFMERYLRPGDGYVDVGANIGTYALLAAALVGASGRVVAFEPHATGAARIRENLALNGIDWVEVHEAAVTDHEGAVEFLQGFDVSNSILTPADAGAEVRAVAATTLDRVLEGSTFAMGKLDVEGFETAALRGAASRLAFADPPVWQIEVMDHQLRKAGSSAAELLDLLEGSGFELVEFDLDTHRLRPLDTARPLLNLLAVHRSARARVDERVREGARSGRAAP